MMKNNIFILLAFIAFTSIAQESDIQIQEVQVTESFIPTVPIANKIMDIPQSQDTFEVNTAVDFFLNSNQYLTSFGVDTIKAAQIKGEPLINLYNTLINVGVGNYFLPNADFFFNSTRDKTLNYGLRLGYKESYMNVQNDRIDKRVDADSRHTNINLFAKKIFEFGTVDANLNREGNNFLAYGTTSEVGKESLNQYWGYSNFDVTLRSNERKHTNYFAKVLVSDINENTERSYGIKSKLKSSYNKIDYSLAIDIDYDLNNIKEDVNFYFDETREILTSIVPTIYKEFKNIDGAYGINYVMVNNPDSSITSTAIYPNVYLDYTFIDEFVRAYAGIDGGIEPNSYLNLSKENPFVLNALDNGNSSLDLINSDVKYNAFIGMKSKLGSNLFFSTELSYAKINFIPFYELDINSTYQNKFKVIYDNGTHLNLHSIIDYKLSSTNGVVLSLNYQSYNLDTLTSYNYKPTFTANLKTYYNIANSILASAEVFAEFDRSVALNGGVIDAQNQLKNIIDVNLYLEYKLNNVFSSYLSAKNLIGGYQLWQNYSVLSPQIQLGITYRY
jgi:hypothetical protein